MEILKYNNLIPNSKCPLVMLYCQTKEHKDLSKKLENLKKPDVRIFFLLGSVQSCLCNFSVVSHSNFFFFVPSNFCTGTLTYTLSTPLPDTPTHPHTFTFWEVYDMKILSLKIPFCTWYENPCTAYENPFFEISSIRSVCYENHSFEISHLSKSIKSPKLSTNSQEKISPRPGLEPMTFSMAVCCLIHYPTVNWWWW